MKHVWLWALIMAGAATGCGKDKDKDEDKIQSSGDAGPKIELDHEFSFAGATENQANFIGAFLPYTVTVDADTQASWKVEITSSECNMTADDVMPMSEQATDTYTMFGGVLKKGDNHLALSVSSEKACKFAGKATLKKDAETTSTGLTVLQSGKSYNFDTTTTDAGGGLFAAFVDYSLHLGETTAVDLEATSWATMNCKGADLQKPQFLYQTGSDEYSSVPDSLPAGDYVIRMMLTSSKACDVFGTFQFE